MCIHRQKINVPYEDGIIVELKDKMSLLYNVFNFFYSNRERWKHLHINSIPVKSQSLFHLQCRCMKLLTTLKYQLTGKISLEVK